MEKLIWGYPDLTRKLFLPGICPVSADMLIGLFESSPNTPDEVTSYQSFFTLLLI